jgi:hypothetical protein
LPWDCHHQVSNARSVKGLQGDTQDCDPSMLIPLLRRLVSVSFQALAAGPLSCSPAFSRHQTPDTTFGSSFCRVEHGRERKPQTLEVFTHSQVGTLFPVPW